MLGFWIWCEFCIFDFFNGFATRRLSIASEYYWSFIICRSQCSQRNRTTLYLSDGLESNNLLSFGLPGNNLVSFGWLGNFALIFMVRSFSIFSRLWLLQLFYNLKLLRWFRPLRLRFLSFSNCCTVAMICKYIICLFSLRLPHVRCFKSFANLLCLWLLQFAIFVLDFAIVVTLRHFWRWWLLHLLRFFVLLFRSFSDLMRPE